MLRRNELQRWRRWLLLVLLWVNNTHEMKVYAHFISFESVFDGATSLEFNVRLDFLVYFFFGCCFWSMS